MKRVHALPAALIAAALLVAPALVMAQSTTRPAPGDRGASPTEPTRPPQANVPPRPRGLDYNTPPGFGGPNPGETHRNTSPHGAQAQLRRINPNCAPGGALSGDAANGQVGRNRARARVCTPE